ncbi:MAG: HI0074 family nucleotidyltransferase substrate-binding subunit [Candidatus Aminicenantes bacterium]|nr:HI0074 family nucleotidyltransferase substrate-binding subunit [Candidatus Aminicenantes bacterium]
MRFKNSLKELKKALQNFEESLNINVSIYPENIKDSIESGQIQKFEFNIELLWKTIKFFLFEEEGIDEGSPKGVIKKCFNLGLLDYEDFENLIRMIDDRNYLSHVYKKEMYQGILKRLPVYLKLMKEVAIVLDQRDRKVGEADKKID